MRKFFKILLFILLGAAIIGTLVYLWNKSKSKPVNYETVQAERRDISKKIIINGTIEPRNEILIKPQISGIITEIYKEPGQMIKEGETIAKVKVVPDISQLSSAESRLKVAKISLEKATLEYERTKQLYESGVMSKEAYETTYTTYLHALEEESIAEENIEIIKEGMSKSTAKYSNTLIKSTISGMILDVPVKVGNSVIQTNNFNEGTTIATIADMSDLIFIGKVDETDVGKIKEGYPLNLIIGAMQDEKCSAVLEYISPKGVLTNGATTFEIKAAVNNIENLFIRSGYSANGEIITSSKEKVFSLPESTIEFQNDSTFVYLLNANKDADPQYIKTSVTTGISDGINIEIIDGIDSTTKVRGKIISGK
ncbi:efflux RND transporter periplasmic adaptor subunit [Bacteroidales bacterium OttesenSCG-928-K03]|nr:efflux RND transporter periplasmic adaptor subunit [Bacteroidales bacterium OttesenSCG-928-K22]MDL2242610.1 efflux RND transporter periplasmic adaptor subunit [Bacteroidales bacterium OttesenSCG-928-K03]